MHERPITSAHILAVGSELTTGATRDTNSGELARELTRLGVRVVGCSTLPDDLPIVADAFTRSLETADLVVSTGGLGPTPDDLTREAIATACGLQARVDPEIERWLRTLFARRNVPMPQANLKQAWLVDGAAALANPHGTAPGWWLERPDGRVLVALPGPPREMWPMWREHALPRLAQGRLGVERASRTLRVTGIGESALVGLIGEDVLRADNPQVATYARADAVDVVVTAVRSGGMSATEAADEAVAALRGRLGEHVFAEGDGTWRDAVAARLDGRTLALVECGTDGQLVALLGGEPRLVHAELVRQIEALGETADRVRREHGADIGLAVVAVEGDSDVAVRIAIHDGRAMEEHERTAFLGGAEGRRRAALAACAVLWKYLAASQAASHSGAAAAPVAG